MSEKPEKLIDISSLAHESGASMIWRDSLVWWEFSPDEMQLFVEKIIYATQQTERARERAKVIAEGWDDRYSSVLDMLVQERKQAEIVLAKVKSSLEYFRDTAVCGADSENAEEALAVITKYGATHES